MAIKRFTFELDDSVDNGMPTGIPDNLVSTVSQSSQAMSTRVNQEEITTYKTGTTDQKTATVDTVSSVGKTFGDIFHMYINKPEAVIVVFTTLGFIICTPQRINWEELQKPLAIGGILSFLWYLTVFIRWLFSGRHKTE